jgi:hypothetical protein
MIAAPEETTPQANAHIGGNQVMGCKTSRMAEGSGRFVVAAEGEAVSVMDRRGVSVG